MKKKILVFSLVSLLIVVLCCSCKEATETSTTTTQQQETETTTKIEKTTKEKTKKKVTKKKEKQKEVVDHSELNEEEFYNIFNSMKDVTWEECLAAANEMWGMDEYQLRVALGWTVNEQYQYLDPYFAYLCAQCPWYHMGSAEGMAAGLAGWDYSGMYSADSLVNTSYGADQYTLNLFYIAITHPYYNIFGCDGLSWYDATIYDELDANGYIFRVWGY